jgi:hypothetical protein
MIANTREIEISDRDDNTVIVIHNTHVASCGTPPRLKHPTPGMYVGSFVGAYGDLWTVEIDRQTTAGVLRGGDIGWENEITIEDDRINGGAMMAEEEFQWLRACWRAATGRFLEPPASIRAMQLMRTIANGESEPLDCAT